MYGLLDCNNFFVSCERLFRPDLYKKPVIVLSSNDGCVVARSEEAKALGISMGAPYFSIESFLRTQGVVVFSSNTTLYKDISRRIMHVLSDMRGEIDQYSIDEAFFKVQNSETEESFFALRQHIMRCVGIPVSIGVAPTKTMAKLANTVAKRGTGVSFLTTEMKEHVYTQVSCGTVWGIGRNMTESLAQEKIRTITDLLSYDITYIRSRFGVSGERIYRELCGEDTSVTMDRTHKESITSTRSLARKTNKKEDILQALAFHVAEVAQELRTHSLSTQDVALVLEAQGASFSRMSGSRHIHKRVVPVNDTLSLLKISAVLLDTIFDPHAQYKKVGIIAGNVVHTAYATPSLFLDDGIIENKGHMIDSIIDSVSQKIPHALRIGLVGFSRVWEGKSQYKSPLYTTQWSDIQTVHTENNRHVLKNTK